MACEKCDCGKTPPGMSGDAKGPENENEIDMTAMWTPRTTAMPERGLAKEGDARAETEEQCPGISSEKCCQASQEVSRLIIRDIDDRKAEEHWTVYYPATSSLVSQMVSPYRYPPSPSHHFRILTSLVRINSRPLSPWILPPCRRRRSCRTHQRRNFNGCRRLFLHQGRTRQLPLPPP